MQILVNEHHAQTHFPPPPPVSSIQFTRSPHRIIIKNDFVCTVNSSWTWWFVLLLVLQTCTFYGY